MTTYTLHQAAKKLNTTAPRLRRVLADAHAIWRDRDGHWRASTAWRRGGYLVEHIGHYYRGPVRHQYVRVDLTEAGLVEAWGLITEAA